MTAAGNIFHQQDIARRKTLHGSIPDLYIYGTIQHNDILPPRRVMPVVIIVGTCPAKNDAGSINLLRERTYFASALKIYLNILKVRFIIVSGIKSCDFNRSMQFF